MNEVQTNQTKGKVLAALGFTSTVNLVFLILDVLSIISFLALTIIFIGAPLFLAIFLIGLLATVVRVVLRIIMKLEFTKLDHSKSDSGIKHSVGRIRFYELLILVFTLIGFNFLELIFSIISFTKIKEAKLA